MSWQKKEMLRREIMPYPLADRATAVPFISRSPLDNVVSFTDEWKTQRLPVQIAAVYLGGPASVWPVDVAPLDESDAGTYYTDWMDITGGPVADGLFGFPGFSVSVAGVGTQSAMTYAEVDQDGDVETTAALAELTSEGCIGTLVVPHLVVLTGGKTITRMRWKIVAGTNLHWSLTTGTLYYFGKE